MQAHDNVKPPAPPKPPITKDDPKNPEPKDPKSKSDVQDRHVEEDQKRIREQLALWGNILGVISGALGLAALFMGPLAGPIAAVASGVLGLAGVILGCMATGIDADCVVNAILALVPAGASAVTIGLRGVLRPIVRDAIDAFGALIGALSGWKSAGSIWPAVR
ncbi:hypothetical protein HNO83_15645 [Leifsonia sp. C5G2]|nr:hypothetical protein [Leifsonia sp. C5G2]